MITDFFFLNSYSFILRTWKCWAGKFKITLYFLCSVLYSTLLNLIFQKIKNLLFSTPFFLYIYPTCLVDTSVIFHRNLISFLRSEDQKTNIRHSLITLWHVYFSTFFCSFKSQFCVKSLYFFLITIWLFIINANYVSGTNARQSHEPTDDEEPRLKVSKSESSKKIPIIFILICSYNKFNYLLIMSD